MDTLMFAVFAVGPTWGTYTQAKAAGQAFFDSVDGAQGGNYTYLTEYFGGQSTPDQTKVSVAFMDPSDRTIGNPQAGTFLTNAAFITEEAWVLDTGWSPPPDVVSRGPISVAPEDWEKTVLGKKVRKTVRKTSKDK